MANIHILPKELAGQIAAGEVIERPASIVKELVENSLDAGATKITIKLENAGLELIEIIDDGCGIDPEDLPLTIIQHATSKLKTFNDLFTLASLGFRGEALFSIQAIAKVTIVSNQQLDLSQGWKLNNHQIQAAPRSKGTTVSVRDLFYNTPVRRKFLKSNKTELYYIEQVLRRLALSHPHVSYKIIINDKLYKNWPAAPANYQSASHRQASLIQRVSQILGPNFNTNAQYCQHDLQELRIYGWLGNLDYYKSTTEYQFLFLNQRYIKDSTIQQALKQLYANCYQAGRHPSYCLFIDLPGHLFDINVHPNKQEVRFSQPYLIYNLVTEAGRKIIAPTKQELAPTRQELAPAKQELAESWQKHNNSILLKPQVIFPHKQAVSISAKTNILSLKKELDLFYYLQQDPYTIIRIQVKTAWQYIFKQLVTELLRLDNQVITSSLKQPQFILLPEEYIRYRSILSHNLQKLGFKINNFSQDTIIILAEPLAFTQLNCNLNYQPALLAFAKHYLSCSQKYIDQKQNKYINQQQDKYINQQQENKPPEPEQLLEAYWQAWIQYGLLSLNQLYACPTNLLSLFYQPKYALTLLGPHSHEFITKLQEPNDL